MAETKPARVVAYIRVSTDEQATEGVSLEAQRARVESFAKAQGFELVEVVVGAGESAKNLDRPGLKKALELLRGVDGLLITTLDRLTRSVRDWGTLREDHFQDRRLISAGEPVDVTTAAGRFILNILFAKAEFERDQVGERTSTALQHKASKGEYTGGGAPYGFRKVVGAEGEAIRVEPEPAEQLVIETARKLAAQPGMSLRKIAKKLEELGFLSRNGKPFLAGQVLRMLES